MKTTFLSDRDMSQVQSILDRHGLSGFDASIRLWGRGKAIEVNGTLGRQELSCLLAIASFLGDSGEDSHDAANGSARLAPSAADASTAVPTFLPDVPLAGRTATI